MRRMSLVFICVMVFVFSSLAVAGSKKKDMDNQQCPVPQQQPTSSTFDMLKSLQGSWKGTHDVDGKKETVHAQYKVTSGGTAVEETLSPGTPHEMISVYTLQGKKVSMTHYCMLGNQPRMEEQSAADNQVVFAFVKTPGINPKKDAYMGGLKLTLKDAKHLDQSWTMLKSGKAAHTEDMSFVREK